LKFLVKLGGTLLDHDDTRRRLAQEITAIVGENHQVVVVHGGGKQLTRYFTDQGINSQFVGGLRVTPPETLDAVIRILAGQVNTHLVAALAEAGARAVGLTGADAGLAQAVQMAPELGAVGRIEHAQADLLDLLTAHGYLPVVACLAGGRGGELFNVNADQMAAACAAAFQADQLIFLTDVEGVLDAERRLVPELTDVAALELIERGVATGGMEAKLRACVAAIRQGAGAVQIAPGGRPGVLAGAAAGRPAGTRIKYTKI
jgi:acetylglutamate kinase